jgi:hypothetical protein
MSIFSFFKKDSISNSVKEVGESNFIILTVRPGVEPSERELKYGDPIDSLLKEKGFGEVTGGGTMLNEPDENGKQTFEFSDVEIEMSSHDKQGLEILLDGLKKNNFPEDTKIMLWDSAETTFDSISAFDNYIKINK